MKNRDISPRRRKHFREKVEAIIGSGLPRSRPYLLGLMSSIPMDWWCRRFIEGHADLEAFNCLRISPSFASTKTSAFGCSESVLASIQSAM